MSGDPRLADEDRPVPIWVFRQEQEETRRRFNRIEDKLDALLELPGRRRWQLIAAGAGALFAGVVSLIVFTLTGGM